MLISYWNCKYADYDEIWDDEGEIRLYGCSHPDNEDAYCAIDNKVSGEKAECPIAENEETS